MNYSSGELLPSLIVLNALFRGKTHRLFSCLESGKTPQEALEGIQKHNHFKKQVFLQELLKTFNPQREWEQCERLGIRLIHYWSEEYPSMLRWISGPPLLLYQQGSLSPSDRAALAVVGSRHPSTYGIHQTKRLSRELSEAGLTLVSGLAKGIDQYAHDTALQIPYGRTLAVVGCGLDQKYPHRSEALREKIISNGVIMSEYPLGTPPLAIHFPVRNRIISGLSLGVFVVEAHIRSGSLITARLALEQGRDVFALPGPIDLLTSGGTNHLIKNGAYLVENSQDILSLLFSDLASVRNTFGLREKVLLKTPAEEREIPPPAEPIQKTSPQSPVFQSLKKEGALDFDQILALQSMVPQALSIELLQLQLEKKIERGVNGLYTII